MTGFVYRAFPITLNNSDPTAYEGLKPVIREDEEQQRRLNNLIFVLKYIIRLAGFELLNRIELKDKRNGREFK